jgi:hypothetical protein
MFIPDTGFFHPEHCIFLKNYTNKSFFKRRHSEPQNDPVPNFSGNVRSGYNYYEYVPGRVPYRSATLVGIIQTMFTSEKNSV